MVTCWECGHQFDPSDERGIVSEDGLSWCPLCATLSMRAARAYAVWNSCQGTFTDGIRGTQAAASAHLAEGGYEGAECSVVPVLVISDKNLVKR